MGSDECFVVGQSFTRTQMRKREGTPLPNDAVGRVGCRGPRAGSYLCSVCKYFFQPQLGNVSGFRGSLRESTCQTWNLQQTCIMWSEGLPSSAQSPWASRCRASAPVFGVHSPFRGDTSHTCSPNSHYPRRNHS